MKFQKRRLLPLILLPVIGVLAFFAIRSFIFSEIHSAIDKKLQALESSGFNVHYDSLSVNWKTNVIEIRQLLLEKRSNDTSCLHPEFISVGKIRANGFRLFPVIFRNVLSFDNFYVEGLKVVMRENSQLMRDSSLGRGNDFTLNIDRSFIESAEFIYTDSVNCKKITAIKSDLTIEGLVLELNADESFQYHISNLSFNSTEIALPEAMYTFTIRQTEMDFVSQILRIDSVQIIPDAGKIEFGRKKGFEIDRYEAIIPFVEASNVAFSFRDSSIVTAGMAEIQFYLKVFRDKRLPFVRKKKLLPVEQLRDLPFNLAVDSLKIRKSYVRYEEFAEGSSEPGSVYFDNLHASIYNISNTSHSGSTKMQARANLFGQGNIDLFVNFPLEAQKRSTASGALANFNLPELNPVLTPTTNIKVESGQMEKLSFNFSFNDIRSDGKIELNYSDLKLTIFKEDDDNKNDPEKDNLKTFIMNAFIFRTNMDEDVPDEKRMGTIAYLRDNNRSIFNFWLKSVVSGIKSAYNLDKAEAKRNEKEDKKQQRLSKREARKLKRVEKRKERG
jgi:hypothetical protein